MAESSTLTHRLYGRQTVKIRRRSLFEFAGWACENCGSEQNLTRDHVVPLALGGDNSNHNIQILCRTCNEAKADSIVVYTTRKKVRKYVRRFVGVKSIPRAAIPWAA